MEPNKGFQIEYVTDTDAVATCGSGHQFALYYQDGVIKHLKCPTCSCGSKIYSSLMNAAVKMTKSQWDVVKKGNHIRYIYNNQLKCRVVVLFGKNYESRKRINRNELRIKNMYTNSFASEEEYQFTLATLLRNGLLKFINDRHSHKTDDVGQIEANINSYTVSPCDDSIVMHLEYQISAAKWLTPPIDYGIQYDQWNLDALQE